MKYTPNQNFIYSLCPLPCTAELRRWTLLCYLSAGLASLCRFKGEWIVQNSDRFSIYTLLKTPLTGKQWASGQELRPSLTSPCPLPMHVVSTNEWCILGLTLKVLVFGCDPRMRGEVDFSLISYLWSNSVFKNDNLGLASLTNPLPDLYPPFTSMKQWLWSQCETETLLVLGVYYLCVKNVGLMCGQCRSCLAHAEAEKLLFYDSSFILFHLHVVISVVFKDFWLKLKRKHT